MNEVNKDIIVEKIKYLSSMPHSALVQHCIYLENENDSYKAQKYITDFISENGIICEKNKEIEELKSKIDKAIEYCEYNDEGLYTFEPDYDYEENMVDNYEPSNFREELLDILKENK